MVNERAGECIHQPFLSLFGRLEEGDVDLLNQEEIADLLLC